MRNGIETARDMQHRKTYKFEIGRNYENKTPTIKKAVTSNSQYSNKQREVFRKLMLQKLLCNTNLTAQSSVSLPQTSTDIVYRYKH
jgi:hypothetical protein